MRVPGTCTAAHVARRCGLDAAPITFASATLLCCQVRASHTALLWGLMGSTAFMLVAAVAMPFVVLE